jgi:anti-sigma-K factor RskA
MAAEEIHELTAAYALDALDGPDAAEYEEHLRHCARCREDLAGLQEAATALAYATPSASPPPALRERIVDQARSERSTVVPLRRRTRALPAAAAVSFALAAAAAVVLWVWSAKLNDRLDSERSEHAADVRALANIADPTSKRIILPGGRGMLAVNRFGRAWLVISPLDPPPGGKVYEAWVIRGKTARRAGIFSSNGIRAVVPLRRRVPAGAVVAVTVERAPGVKQPTAKPIIASKPV